MVSIPNSLLILWLAVVLDFVGGELPNAIHPVAWIGKVVAIFQRRAPRVGRWLPFLAGALFMVAGIVAAVVAGRTIELLASTLPLPISIFSQALALKCMFSITGLSQAGRAVQTALERGDLNEARRLLSWHLVSRDTASLNESQTAAATIESLSENASDSCVAPLLFFAIGGLPAAFAYRFVNTCDAMLGYRDAEREWLGKAAARLDDVANLVPARLTAALIIGAGAVTGRSPFQASSIWFRDRNLTASPNAGHPMSAAAGVLGIQLDKVGHYQLGSGQRNPSCRDIARARAVLWCTAFLAVAAVSAAIFWIR